MPTGHPRVTRAVTPLSPTGSTLTDKYALAGHQAPEKDPLDAHGRSLQPVPCGAEGGGQDQDGGVLGAVEAELQGYGRRAHPPTLPHLTISHRRGVGPLAKPS